MLWAILCLYESVMNSSWEYGTHAEQLMKQAVGVESLNTLWKGQAPSPSRPSLRAFSIALFVACFTANSTKCVETLISAPFLPFCGVHPLVSRYLPFSFPHGCTSPYRHVSPYRYDRHLPTGLSTQFLQSTCNSKCKCYSQESAPWFCLAAAQAGAGAPPSLSAFLRFSAVQLQLHRSSFVSPW